MMKKVREQKMCNKLFELVMSRERRERSQRDAAARKAVAAAAAASATEKGTEKGTEKITEEGTKKETEATTKKNAAAAADVAGGGEVATPASVPVSASVSPAGAGGNSGGGKKSAVTAAANSATAGSGSASSGGIVGSTMPIMGSLTERATEEEKKIAAESIRIPTEAEVQMNVRCALGFLLNKHHASRRALADMRKAVVQGQEAKRQAQAKSKVNVPAETNEVKLKDEKATQKGVKGEEEIGNGVRKDIDVGETAEKKGEGSASKPEVKQAATAPATPSGGAPSAAGGSGSGSGGAPPSQTKKVSKRG